MDARLEFYQRTIARWIPDRNATILVLAGGSNDRNILQQLGFTQVVISNLDAEWSGRDLSPFQWSYQNAEALTYPDESFDYVIVHAGLHHCYSPHRALLEMYRVARLGAIAFEPCDNFVVRTLQKFGLAQTYEQVAVFRTGGKAGGVANTEIPNYIYRWTEGEIEKTIQTFAPQAQHRFDYAYGSDEPAGPLQEKSGLKKLVILGAMPIYRIFVALFPKQQNLFAFKVNKPHLPDDLHPWITVGTESKLGFNLAWGQQKFKAPSRHAQDIE